jgi:putative sigma-54 modulation protein
MIKKIDIAGIHYEVSDKMKKYIESKIGRLDRYMPRTARKGVRVEAKLSESKNVKSDKYTAEVVLHYPNGTVTASDSTINMYAAVDIVEAKLKNQLRKHKEKHQNHKSDRKGLLRRIRRLTDRDFRGAQN